MAKLNVEIVTPEKRFLTTQVDEAVVPGEQGLFGVRSGHTAFLSLMEPGVLTLKEGTTTSYYFVSGGFVEVSENKVLVLADSAEKVEGINVDSARKLMEEAQGRLRGLSQEDARFQVEQATVKRETARIAAASVRR